MTHVSVATSNRRLLKLADFLDTLPPERFNYAYWVGHDWDGRPDLSCGTTACALGWATTMPTFRRLGLRLSGWGVPILVGMDETRDQAFDVASQVFGITPLESLFLFDFSVDGEDDEFHGRRSPGEDATAKEVAEHIRRFVRERAK